MARIGLVWLPLAGALCLLIAIEMGTAASRDTAKAGASGLTQDTTQQPATDSARHTTAPTEGATSPSPAPSTTLANDVPEVQSGHGPLNPARQGWVTDAASLLDDETAAYLRARLEAISASGVATRVMVVGSTGAETIDDFARRIAQSWNAMGEESRVDMLMAIALDDRRIRIETNERARQALSDQDAQRLIDDHFVPLMAQGELGGGLRTLVDQLDRSLAARRFSALEPQALESATSKLFNEIGDALTTWDGASQRLVPASQARLDSAVAALESMQRPPRGDRKTARQLHGQGLSLIGQQGFEKLAIEKLQAAHRADPLDVQVLNDLAYAEMQGGMLADASVHLYQTLRLAPKRTSAWVNLAEVFAAGMRDAQEGRSIGTGLYLVGYFFSGDRAKTVEFLRGRASAADVPDGVRSAAHDAFKLIAPLPQEMRAHAEAQMLRPAESGNWTEVQTLARVLQAAGRHRIRSTR